MTSTGVRPNAAQRCWRRSTRRRTRPGCWRRRRTWPDGSGGRLAATPSCWRSAGDRGWRQWVDRGGSRRNPGPLPAVVQPERRGPRARGRRPWSPSALPPLRARHRGRRRSRHRAALAKKRRRRRAGLRRRLQERLRSKQRAARGLQPATACHSLSPAVQGHRGTVWRSRSHGTTQRISLVLWLPRPH